MSEVLLTRRRFLGAGVGVVGVGVGGIVIRAATASATADRAGELRAFVGGYTVGPHPAAGIGVARIDHVGQITIDTFVGGVANPFYLALHPATGTLYAVSDVPEGRVFALRTGGAAGLTPLNDQLTGGQGPVHVSVHPGGRWLLVVNYDSGSVVSHPIRPDGSLGPVASLLQHQGSGPSAQQGGPHPHMTLTDPTGDRVLVPDKGTDSLYVHDLDRRTGRLGTRSAVSLASGSGPRHVVAHPSWRHVYVVTELASTVVTCAYDVRTGTARQVASVSIVPPGTPSLNAPSAIRISTDGRFLYAANRGLDAISILAVGAAGARPELIDLVPVSHGLPGSAQPWDIVLDPSGRFLYVADEASSTLGTFAVDRRTGLLSPAARPVSTGSPVCLVVAGPV